MQSRSNCGLGKGFPGALNIPVSTDVERPTQVAQEWNVVDLITPFGVGSIASTLTEAPAAAAECRSQRSSGQFRPRPAHAIGDSGFN